MRLKKAFFTCVAFACAHVHAELHVDFSYAPPEWQTAICLPDDPLKSLADKGGALLYHYKQGGREFGTRIGVEVVEGAVWKKQDLLSPRIPIVRTVREAPGLVIVEEAFAVTAGPGVPEKTSPLRQPEGGPSRTDVILIHVTNAGSEPRTLRPGLLLDTVSDVRIENRAVVLAGGEAVFSSLAAVSPVRDKRAELEPLTVQAGKTATFFIGYGRGRSPATVEEALAARANAVRFWEGAPLPYGRIEVPDAGIQALVDSSIRNIWQAREIKNGVAVFQVGPTCYRGLWIVDGAFLLEAATMLGAGDEARAGVAYELTHQRADGGMKVMDNFFKENGIVLWTCYRHAQLTRDRAWLESVWPKLERIAGHIRELRKETMTDATPLDDGLVPPGFPDGGQGGVHPEYTNPLWNLVGLHAFVDAARWLGKENETNVWQQEYDDFMRAFRRAAARDGRRDAAGNAYLPNLMGASGTNDLPQSAQWAFCQAVYPGQLFAHDDPLVAGNLAMLEATEREGMVYGTGWDATGLWNYFASFYGHAWLWQGNGRKAAETLYAFANHAAPVLDWREEQSLRGEPFKKVGDMPHNWASAEFIRLTAHLLAIDRGDELHLFEGLPSEWTKPGMATRLNGLATPFGKLTASLVVSADGKTARLCVAPLPDASCKRMIAHLGPWAADGGDRELELDPKTGNDRTVRLRIRSFGAAGTENGK